MFVEQVPVWLRWVYGSVLWRKDAHKKVLYLTFDDGPNPNTTPLVLNLLDRLQVPATFFCVGRNAEKYPEMLDMMQRRGHQIGVHGYSHQRGLFRHGGLYTDDVKRAGKHVKSHLFRPPHGALWPHQARRLAKQYQVVFWDVLTRDYDAKLTPEQVYKIAVRYARPGSIVVFHDSDKARRNMIEAFPRAVEYWKEQGYTFETL